MKIVAFQCDCCKSQFANMIPYINGINELCSYCYIFSKELELEFINNIKFMSDMEDPEYRKNLFESIEKAKETLK